MIDGLLRVGGGGDDEPLVVLQDLQPARDVGGVILARLEGQTEVRAEEGGAELCDQFFASIAGIPETLTAEVPVQARGMARPVDLMPISA